MVVLVHVWVDINKEMVLRLDTVRGLCVTANILSGCEVHCTASAPLQLSLVLIPSLCFGSWIHRIDVGHWIGTFSFSASDLWENTTTLGHKLANAKL